MKLNNAHDHTTDYRRWEEIFNLYPMPIQSHQVICTSFCSSLLVHSPHIPVVSCGCCYYFIVFIQKSSASTYSASLVGLKHRHHHHLIPNNQSVHSIIVLSSAESPFFSSSPPLTSLLWLNLKQSPPRLRHPTINGTSFFDGCPPLELIRAQSDHCIYLISADSRFPIKRLLLPRQKLIINE